MNQLTVMCSPDEESRVIAALDGARVTGFLRIGDATGHTFLDPGEVPRTMTWEAVMLIAPRATREQVERVVSALGEYTRSCDVEPCLRIVVSEVTEVL